jgi:hypothetical protein
MTPPRTRHNQTLRTFHTRRPIPQLPICTLKILDNRRFENAIGDAAANGREEQDVEDR